MSKSLRIVLLLFCVVAAPSLGYAQPMPERLDMGWLLSQPKYRNIHHDSFCRADNDNEIGNNALPGRSNVLAYKTLGVGDVRVGIKDNYATNFQKTGGDGRCIKFVEVGRNDFHITAVRANDNSTDVKVAFFIKDINHYYYVALSEKNYEVFRFINGKQIRVGRGRCGGKRLEILVEDNKANVVVDGKTQKSVKLKGWVCDEKLCGLLFDNSSVSCVDDFIVDYRDFFVDAGIDEAIERGEVKKPAFGTYCAEEGVCTQSDKYKKNGNYSYRFELKKPTEEQVKRNRDNALHSTVMLHRVKQGGNKPLDSFILSVDVLFPDGADEKWILDELFAEIFIQVHHAGYNIPFSPSLSIVINKGRLYLSTTWLESIAEGTSPFDNELSTRAQNVARINSIDEEAYLYKVGYGNYSNLPYLEKGKWHNITLYAKLGYNNNQQPRTVLYINQEKIIDWNTPNAYNCQEYGEFMEFGIYKWNWNTQENRDKTPIEKRVLYFDNIHFYI